MAGWSFKFDPATDDLIDDGKGSFVRTYNADTHVQLQLQCHAGACWQDEQLGSRFHDLSFFQRKPETMLPDESRRALGVLVARGRIDNLEVTAERRNAGRVDVKAKFRDASTGQVVTTFLKAGG